MGKERIAYLDVVRVVACLMVILMHSPMPSIGAPGFVLTGISFITSPCIGLFFMVSGALLLPVNTTMVVFYKRRIPKVVIPTLIWTILYLLVNIIEGTLTLNQLPKIALSIPFSAQGSGILWFMYTLIGLYLISPVVSPWLTNASRKEIEFVLCLWLTSLFFPVLSNCLFVNQGNTGVLFYFTGYSGYYLLGYYLNRYQPRYGKVLSLLMIIIPIIICGIILKSYPQIDFYRYFWYLSIFVVSMSCGWFSLISSLVTKEKRALMMCSSLTLGIYLSHILIMRNLIWKLSILSELGWHYQIILTVFLTFVISLSISYLLASLPFGRFIIGYQIRSKSI